MPIYMKVEGIKGNVRTSSHAGGANFAMSDGSVKFIRHSIGDGPRVSLFSGSDQRSGNGGGILVSRIAVPNLPNGLIDERDANAGFKAGMLFEGMKNLIIARGLILSIPANGANKFNGANNLKQLGLAVYGRFPSVKLVITGSGDPQGVAIELENVLITNYSLGGHGAASAGNGIQGGKPTVMHLNFMK